MMILFIFTLPIIGGLITYWTKQPTFSIVSIGISLLLSLGAIIIKGYTSISFEWLPGYFIGVHYDKVAAILIVLVLLISLLVHFFSLEYVKEDSGKNRYFAKLGLFTSSMVGLLLADHLILLFVFWELVGLSSYLLIGFWYKKEGVPNSARLAFMVNRVADVALLAGILILNQAGSLNLSEMEGPILLLPSLLIAIGAFGKSAQFPFSGWLTKAMVGPTPVSALIHAATMVAAGVYLLFRVAPFLDREVLTFVALVGTFTAFYGGLSALFQHDIKKVLAYSTISQLGYMVIGIGVGAADAALFHLVTHAFFKAGLFLGAGSVIHYLHQSSGKDGQDMRFMGGLKNKLPWTFRSFLICGSALAGVPLFSGFMSKEGILIAGWQWAEQMGTWAYLVPDIALITAMITALYVGRMLLLVFYGKSRFEIKLTPFKENGFVTAPLIILALGSMWFVFDVNPFEHHSWLDAFLNFEIAETPAWIERMGMLLSVLMAGVGLVLAYSFFKPGSNYNRNYPVLESRFKVAENGFYMVQLYQVIATGFHSLAVLALQLDRKIVDRVVHFAGIGTVVVSKVISLIDRFLVDGPINLFGYLSSFLGRRFAGLSGRDLQTQLSWLLVFVILILSWILFF
ncbi:NADH-quinone oxidoreductase subunit L [Ekhidna sp.]|uniref:NADH-quinone oxidoreductase subunit 5 family protein n=1 Tax=Ekhidna sp. TaxID=2608089 RepID=UPI003299C4E6